MVNQVDVRQLADVLADGSVLLDVREPFEYASGHVPGAISLPMHLVPLRLDELPRQSTVYVICATGNRSWQVCHFLGQHGVTAVNVSGGTASWQAAGLPLEATAGEIGAGLENAR
jgi:rhodanese-related sulfurtransferase